MSRRLAEPLSVVGVATSDLGRSRDAYKQPPNVAQLTASEWAQLLSAFRYGRQQKRFQESRKRTIVALIYVLAHDLPWTSLPTHFGSAHGLYRNCMRWASNGALDALLIKLAELGHTSTWCDVSRRYGGQPYDNMGVRRPGMIHIVALRQAHSYREMLNGGKALVQGQPVRRVLQEWSISPIRL